MSRWRIESPHRAVRLYALRELSEVGSLGAWDILERGLREPRAAWALARSAPLRLRLFPLARFLRYRRKRPWLKKLDRATGLMRLRQARHEMAAFAWADRLVREHGEKAISGLLDTLRHPSTPSVAEAAAWALGTLGRTVLAEVLDAFRQATRPTVRRLAMVLWYLGPEAHGAEKALVRWLGEPDVDAALLAMEGAASVAVAQAGGAHVWLDANAVTELAMKAFGDGDRAAAVLPLGGFGPASEQALHVLEQLLQDKELEPLAREALRALDHPGAAYALFTAGEEADACPLLYSPDHRAQQAALEQCRPEFLWPKDLDRARELLSSPAPGVRLAALKMLPVGPWMARMLDDPWFVVRLAAVERTNDDAMLLKALGDRIPRVALAAARKLSTRYLEQLAQHPMPEIRVFLAFKVGQRRLDWEIERLAEAVCDGAISPEILEALRGLLPEPSFNACVRRALQTTPRDWVVARLNLPELGLLLDRGPLRLRRLAARALREHDELPEWMVDRSLNDPSWTVRALLGRALERTASLTDRPELRWRLCIHPRTQVAVAALKTLYKDDPAQALPLARAALASPVAAMRAAGARQLLLCNESLDEYLADPAPEVRRLAYQVCSAELLERGWKDPDAAVRAEVCRALRASGRLPADLRDELAEHRHVTREAVELARELLPDFSEVALAALETADLDEEALWAVGLGRLIGLDLLLERLQKNPTPEIARMLALALGESHQAVEWLSLHWAELPYDLDPELERAATVVVSNAVGFQHINLVTALIEQPRPGLARAATAVLSCFPRSNLILFPLRRAAQHGEAAVRRQAVRVLTDVEDNYELLAALSQDPDEQVATEAARALARLKVELRGRLTAENAPVFRRHLQDPDLEVRWHAAQLLMQHGDFMPEALPVFLERCELAPLIELPVPEQALVDCLSSPRPEVRQRACYLLSEIGYRGALPLLEKLQTSDPDPLVRRALRDAVDSLRNPPAS